MTQGYYGPPPQPPRQPPMIVWDVTISVILLGFTLLVGGCAAFIGLFSLAFLDDCRPETCSAGDAFAAVAIALIVAGIVGCVGLVFAVLRMSKRQVSWPISLATTVACSAILAAGAFGWANAVGI